MRYRELGKTGITVSEIGLGTWQIGGPYRLGGRQIGWGDIDDRTAREVLKSAVDSGITFFDTADVYGGGHSEELIGETLGSVRDEIVISSKVGNREGPDGGAAKDFSRAWIREGCEASLRRLKSDYIDVYHLHSPPSEFEYSEEVVGTLEELRREGKIRSYGISILPPGRGMRPSDFGMQVLESGRRCDFFQVVYNMLEREAEEYLLPACAERGVGVIVRVPFQSGFLTGKMRADTEFAENDVRAARYTPEKKRAVVEQVERLRFLTEGGKRSMAQAALQFCLAAPGVSTVIPGARNPEQVKANAGAVDAEPLSEEEHRLIREALSD
jgi:aryl-alcohol dehydrogenase-like predicted oxidoreductase